MRLSLTYLGPTRPYGRGGPRREGAVPQGPVNMCVPIEEQLDVLTPVFSLYSRDKPHWLSRYIEDHVILTMIRFSPGKPAC